MQKKFSGREVALLMLPVLAIGGLGLWISSRPVTPVPHSRAKIKFQVMKPTTLEAFEGFDGAFEVGCQGGVECSMTSSSPYLELKTEKGTQVSRLSMGTEGFWSQVWGHNTNNNHFKFKLAPVPPGTLSFGFDGFAQPQTNSAGTPSPWYKPARVSGKWKIDRARIKAPNLAAMPRQPQVELVSVTVTTVTRASAGRSQVTADSEFALGQKMNRDTSFEAYFGNKQTGRNQQSRTYGMGWSTNSGKRNTPRRWRTRIVSWTAYCDSLSITNRIRGRATADERWPLGFEIEPFRMRDVKVGQKLKFKSFPVALPK